MNNDSVTACAGCGGIEFKAKTQPEAEDANEDVSKLNSDTPRPFKLAWNQFLQNPVVVYRILVILSFGMYVLWFLLPLIDHHFLSDDTIYLLRYHGYGAILPIPTRVAWMVLFINLAVAPGLWFFCISARWVYVCLIIFFIIVRPLAGVQIDTPVGAFLGTIGTLADGGLLVLSFMSPIREKFEESREPVAD